MTRALSNIGSGLIGFDNVAIFAQHASICPTLFENIRAISMTYSPLLGALYPLCQHSGIIPRASMQVVCWATTTSDATCSGGWKCNSNGGVVIVAILNTKHTTSSSLM